MAIDATIEVLFHLHRRRVLPAPTAHQSKETLVYHKPSRLLSLLLALSLLAGCAYPVITPEAASQGQAQPVAETATAEPTAEAVPEAAAEMPSDDALDAAFAAFLGSMVRYDTISLEDANLALFEEPLPFLLDVRTPAEAEESGHIEGAVLIPLRELGSQLDLLPAFDTPIIVYCGSGWRATIALTALEALGWTDVQVLAGGSFTGWVEAGYAVVEGAPPAAEVLAAAEPDPMMVAQIDTMLTSIPEGWGVITNEALNLELIEDDALMLIDVRRPEERTEKGFIDAPNTQMAIPLESFMADKAMWPADKDAPIVVYCGSGHRSTIGMSILRAYGYTNVRSLKGGFGGWAGAGFPVTQPVTLDTVFDDFLANMEGYNIISLEDTNLALIEDRPPFLLDVREVAEVSEKGHIEGAVVIPLRELAQSLAYLPSFDTPIIAYCGSGWRATIAMTALQAMGWTDVRVMKDGSFTGWVEAGYPIVEGLPSEAPLLDAALPEPEIQAKMDAMLSSLPEGWGVIRPDALNTALIETPDLLLIDVRRPEEVAEKGLIAADQVLTIPLEEFIAQKEMWPAELDTPIVVYCGSGHRSTIAMAILGAYGYTDVLSLSGGFAGWVEAGYPTVEYVAP
jgi:rhodanese-related sulfurtransferase